MPRPSNPHPYKKTVTRYILDGKQVPKSTPGAVKRADKTSTYYGDIPSVGTVSLGTTDLGVAWKRLNDRLKEQHQRELGVRDSFSDHAKLPLLGHLRQWLAVLAAKGTGQKQRDIIEGRLIHLFDVAAWGKLAHVTADSANLALAKLQKGGRSAQTRNHYVTHLRGFCSWLTDSGRLRANPVRSVEKVNVEADRRHSRRSPERAEVAELLAWLASPGACDRKGMTGPQRAIGYQVSMATGYRANELRSLTWESFDLDAATVTLLASADKRGRADTHPLPSWLVEELRRWFVAGGECWDRFPETFPGRLLKADLAAARAVWIDAATDADERKKREASSFLRYETPSPNGSLFWDFHSLRVWYISELAGQPNMDLKTLMTLARHSTPQLSLNVYAKARDANLRAATDQLIQPGKPVDPLRPNP